MSDSEKPKTINDVPVSYMHSISSQLSALFNVQNSEDGLLTRKVQGALNLLSIKKEPDGDFIINTPSFDKLDNLSAYADVVNRGLGYLGVDINLQNGKFDHSDPTTSILNNAVDDSIGSLIQPRQNTYDHISFRVTADSVQKAMDDLATKSSKGTDSGSDTLAIRGKKGVAYQFLSKIASTGSNAPASAPSAHPT